MLPLDIGINIGRSLLRTHLNGELLEVRERNNYRWFHYGGDAVQAAIDIKNTASVLLPIPQSMLLFLLWQRPSLQVLNLGMGAGTIENALDKISDIQVTSVEAELEIIDMARNYFLSAKTSNIHHQNAEAFLKSSKEQYDIILCDIFYQQQSPLSLYNSTFYQHLSARTRKSGCAFINLFPESKENLLRAMSVLRPYFNHVALIEFDDYKNIVLILSQVAFPSKKELRSSNNALRKLLKINFEAHINNIHYVPLITK